MENLTIEYLFKRITNLEKLVEQYFNYLKTDNELDFILKGGYFLLEDLDDVMSGNYWGANE